ncbi:MAG: winged helix-turn-helix domain-containing protein [Candidatus Bathyarchaeia archaeon]
MGRLMGQEIKELDIFRIYKLLDHPVRKKIIELLGEQKKAGFKEFTERLKINVGTLYYHFDVLSGLITQDEDRKYVLTDLGKMAYEFLTSKKEQLIEIEVKEKAKMVRPQNKILKYTKTVFWPSGFFFNLYQSRMRHLADVVLIIAFGSWIMNQAKLEPSLFFFDFEASLLLEMVVARLLLGLLVILVVSEVISRTFFRRGGGNLSLLIGATFSLLPLYVFPSLLLLERWNILPSLSVPWSSLLQLFLQAWSLCMLSCAISLSKGLRIEKAAVISLLLMYFNIGYIFILQRL